MTGGSRGLGKNTALHLARKGVDVILTYHSRKAEAEAVVAEIERLGARALALQLDMADCRSFADFAVTDEEMLPADGSASSSITWSTMRGSASAPDLRKPRRSSSTSS